MDELQIFKNDEFGDIRTLNIDGVPYVMLKDACNILGLVNSSKVKERLNADGVTSSYVIDRMGRKQQALFINESNLYRLIFQSRKPEAEKFSDWVTSEVLPAIRKNGSYALPQVEVLEDEPQTLDLTQLELDQRIKIASIIASCRRERLALVAKVLSLDMEVMHQPIITNEISDEELIQRFMDNIWEKLDDVTPNAILYAQYQNFCRENGCVPRTKNGFGHYVNKNYPIAPVMTRIKDRGVCIRCRGIRKLTKTLQEGGVLA